MDPILIVEDQAAIADLIALTLEHAGWPCHVVCDGRAAADCIETGRWSLILLDIMLPGFDGYELKQYIADETPVIFLTARIAVADRVKGLRMGAQDYICKPFEPEELAARVEAVLRRTGRGNTVLHAFGVVLDPTARRVRKNGEDVSLTPREYDLLEVFLRNRGVTLYRDALFERIWGEMPEEGSRTLDLHVQRLRKKLGWHSEIRTLYNIGYLLEEGAP